MSAHHHDHHEAHHGARGRRFDAARAQRLDEPERLEYLRPERVVAFVDAPPNATVVDFGTGTNDYMFLTLNDGNGTPRFAITDSGAGGEQQINGTAELPLNTWSHVAVTFDGRALT